MSLREEMWKYEQITGESAEHVPIIKLGAFLDGYENGLEALKPKWIPCSERLPEENGNYLVTVEANDGTASIKFQMVDHYGPKWLHEGKHEKVIAWMPLPEPYKAESEENDDGN